MTVKPSAQAQPVNRAQRRAMRRTARLLRRESKFYWKRIVNRLSQMGLMFWAINRDVEGKPDGRTKQTIKLAAVHATTEEIYYKIDTTKLPYRVGTLALADPELLEEVSLSIHRRLTCVRSLTRGTWLVLERDSAHSGIPSRVSYAKTFEAIPQHANPLSLVVGVARNRELLVRDLARMPHLLIGGATGQGKSVFLNSIICTLAQNNAPDSLSMTMIDLKGGVELDPYRHIPHLRQAVIEEPGEVEAVFDAFLKEIVHRSRKLKRGGVRDIVGWNRRYPTQRMDYHVMVIDELSLVLLDKSINKADKVTNLLARIGATGRAPGCLIIAATQRPSSDVVHPLIRANLPARVAFSVARRPDSMTIIETTHAFELAPAGRLMYRNGPELIQAQAPYISIRTVNAIVAKLAQHDYAKQRPRWQELCKYALENLGGDLPRDVLWQQFPDVPQNQVYAVLKNISGQTIGIDGQTYYVEPGRRGKSARLILATNGNGQSDVAESPAPQAEPVTVGQADTLAWLDELRAEENGRHED